MLTRRMQKGFSIIEVLVVVTVMAILLAAVGPGTVSWVRSANTQNAAEVAHSGLRRARAEAVKRQRPVTFWLVSTNGSAAPDDSCTLATSSASWVISLDDPTGNCGATPSAETAPRLIESAGVALPQGIVVQAKDSAGDPARSVTFNAWGIPTAAGNQIARIEVTHPDGSVRPLRLEVSTSGSIRMCDAHIDKSSDDPRACRE